jgi:hypothetical protein
MLYYPTLISIIEVILVTVPVLLTVAFVTVAERKTMASMQRRLGPNIVGYYGLLQAFADALKLLLKEYVLPKANINNAITALFIILWVLLGGPLLPVLSRPSFIHNSLNNFKRIMLIFTAAILIIFMSLNPDFVGLSHDGVMSMSCLDCAHILEHIHVFSDYSRGQVPTEYHFMNVIANHHNLPEAVRLVIIHELGDCHRVALHILTFRRSTGGIAAGFVPF